MIKRCIALVTAAAVTGVACSQATTSHSAPDGMTADAGATSDSHPPSDGGNDEGLATAFGPDGADAAPPADTPASGGQDAAAGDASAATAFTLTSTAFTDKGTLPDEFTCDGVGHSPPLTWSGMPVDTASLVLLMTTQAKDGTKWNWVLHGIAPTAQGLGVGQTGVGTAGLTSDGPELKYYPPCSQGPGAKFYTFTLFALSAQPPLPASTKAVTGPVLTAAIAGITLAQSSITVSYTRPN